MAANANANKRANTLTKMAQNVLGEQQAESGLGSFQRPIAPLLEGENHFFASHTRPDNTIIQLDERLKDISFILISTVYENVSANGVDTWAQSKTVKWRHNKKLKIISHKFLNAIRRYIMFDQGFADLRRLMGKNLWLPELVNNESWLVTAISVTPNYDNNPFAIGLGHPFTLHGLFDFFCGYPLLNNEKTDFTSEEIQKYKNEQLYPYVYNFLYDVIDKSHYTLEYIGPPIRTKNDLKELKSDPRASFDFSTNMIRQLIICDPKNPNLQIRSKNIVGEPGSKYRLLLDERRLRITFLEDFSKGFNKINVPYESMSAVTELQFYQNNRIAPLSLLKDILAGQQETHGELKENVANIKEIAKVELSNYRVKRNLHTIIYNLIFYNCAKALAAYAESQETRKAVEQGEKEENIVANIRDKKLEKMKRQILQLDDAGSLWWCKDIFTQLVAQNNLYGSLLEFYAQPAGKGKAGGRNQLQVMAAQAELPTKAVVLIDAMNATMRAYNAQTERLVTENSAKMQLASQCTNIVAQCLQRCQLLQNMVTGGNRDKNEKELLGYCDTFIQESSQLKELGLHLKDELQKPTFYKKMLLVDKNDNITGHNAQFSAGFAFSLNVLLKGAPGTSKSESTKAYSALLKDMHMTSGNMVTCSVADVHGQYVGETAAKTRQRVAESLDGVLFLDEAYAMVSSPALTNVNYGAEFNGVLVERMSRSPLLFHVVAAGYAHEMENVFLMSNPGYSRRFRTQIALTPTFDDLVKATVLMLQKVKPETRLGETKVNVEKLFEHFKSKSTYKDQPNRPKDYDRIYFFPGYFSSCQEIATLVLEGSYGSMDGLPKIFHAMRVQEQHSAKKQKKPLQEVIDDNAALLQRHGRFGETNLIDWNLAAPILEENR